jgi:hypothetical protein
MVMSAENLPRNSKDPNHSIVLMGGLFVRLTDGFLANWTV